jgi:hypothetical protein
MFIHGFKDPTKDPTVVSTVVRICSQTVESQQKKLTVGRETPK